MPGRGMPLRGSPPKGLCARGDLVVKFAIAPPAGPARRRRVRAGSLGVVRPPVVLLTSRMQAEGAGPSSSSDAPQPLAALSVRVLVDQTAIPVILAHRQRAAAMRQTALSARTLRRERYCSGADAAEAVSDEEAAWLRRGAAVHDLPAPLEAVYVIVGGTRALCVASALIVTPTARRYSS